MDSYLFTWDNIPGDENAKLLTFLRKEFGIDGTLNARIGKTEDHNTIFISHEKRSISLILNNEKTEVNLVIDNEKKYRFIAKTEDDVLKVHQCKCYYRDLITKKKIDSDIEYIVCGRKDPVLKGQNLINSIQKIYKFIDSKKDHCIFIINPYQKPNEVTYFQLGYAMGKGMQMVGLFTRDDMPYLSKDLMISSRDVANDIMEFIQLMSDKLGMIRAYQPHMTDEGSKEASEKFGYNSGFMNENPY